MSHRKKKKTHKNLGLKNKQQLEMVKICAVISQSSCFCKFGHCTGA